MFEEVPFMMLFLIFAVTVSYLLLNGTPHPLNKLIWALGIVGIVLHEVCHLLACFITNTRVVDVKLIGRVRSREKSGKKSSFDYGGSVTVHPEANFSFLQSVIIGFAPLVANFWLFSLILDQMFNPHIDGLLFLMFLLVEISLIIGASPSLSDIACIPAAFSRDSTYSLYQIFLLGISILIAWGVTMAYSSYFFHEIVAYGLIMISYYGLKYGFKAVNGLLYRLRSHHIPYRYKLDYDAFTQKTYKPFNPRKLGIEEAQW